jgi:ferrous iron transport protein A
MMPITMSKESEKNIIKKITGKDDVRRHLASLGFVVGENVTVITKIAGNVILSVKNTRIALNKEMANRIMV